MAVIYSRHQCDNYWFMGSITREAKLKDRRTIHWHQATTIFHWARVVCIIPGCIASTLKWRHNGHGDVSNHQLHLCLLNRLFRRRSKKTSKLRVTGLCEGKAPMTGEFPTQKASDAENVSIWLRHHDEAISTTTNTNTAQMQLQTLGIHTKFRFINH